MQNRYLNKLVSVFLLLNIHFAFGQNITAANKIIYHHNISNSVQHIDNCLNDYLFIEEYEESDYGKLIELFLSVVVFIYFIKNLFDLNFSVLILNFGLYSLNNDCPVYLKNRCIRN